MALGGQVSAATELSEVGLLLLPLPCTPSSASEALLETRNMGIHCADIHYQINQRSLKKQNQEILQNVDVPRGLVKHFQYIVICVCVCVICFCIYLFILYCF